MIKYFEIVFYMLFLFLFSCKTNKEAPLDSKEEHVKMDLFLLVGQSNMAGRGELTESDSEAHPRVFSFSKDYSWILAKDPIHFDISNRGVGPGLTFGKEMAKYYPDRRIGLIPAAVGGTKIAHWNPDGSERCMCYYQAIRRTKLAMKEGTLRGIVWQQGESDSNMQDALKYKQKINNLINSFRKDLDNEDLPIVLGAVGDFLKSNAYKIVNNALLEVSNQNANVGFSKASNLGHIGDQLHFNSNAQHENGKNMAEVMISLLEK